MNINFPDYLTMQMPNIEANERFVIVSIVSQTAYWVECLSPDSTSENRQTNAKFIHVLKTWPVSSAKAGVGNLRGSQQTPLGWFEVRIKIGEGMAENSVFVGRRATGEIYSEDLATQYPNRDWILTRVLWLTGMQKGLNRRQTGEDSAKCDTLSRFIYFHGTPENRLEPIGEPHSHGCLRMGNEDLLALFELVSKHTKILIAEPEFAEIQPFLTNYCAQP